ncbi:unnamed protein product [Closterium sp. NIES-54]
MSDIVALVADCVLASLCHFSIPYTLPFVCSCLPPLFPPHFPPLFPPHFQPLFPPHFPCLFPPSLPASLSPSLSLQFRYVSKYRHCMASWCSSPSTTSCVRSHTFAQSHPPTLHCTLPSTHPALHPTQPPFLWPLQFRYVSKYRHCDGKLVLKATDDRVCIKFRTDQAQDAKKMERLNNLLFTLMARGPDAIVQPEEAYSVVRGGSYLRRLLRQLSAHMAVSDTMASSTASSSTA